jgi:hypothetical protein
LYSPNTKIKIKGINALIEAARKIPKVVAEMARLRNLRDTVDAPEATQ